MKRSARPSAGVPVIRRRLLLCGWLAAGALLTARAAELQILQGHEWRAEASRQHRAQGEVAAPRGGILDRDGTALAISHEAFRVGIAPHELRDRDEAARILGEVLSLPAAEARRATHSERRWVRLPAAYPPAVREALAGVRGIYLERELLRFHPHERLARGILGTLIDGTGRGGVEQQFEEHLRGLSGTRVVARDSEGTPIPGETWLVRPPLPGGDVVLTLDRDLQEIADEALRDALEATGARGGDLLVTDPRTGEILAMVSVHEGASNRLGAVNTPYEPGSTAKPFTVASLLRLDRASMTDSVDTGHGEWRIHGRTIRDVQSVGTVTLAHALQVSSNVGVARMAARLRPEEQFEALRDFGFGVPTGIDLPGEASGTLRHPRGWSRLSPASLAIGYELAVTPLQMAMAYGALANGGLLMEPRIIRELRGPDGRPLEVFEPRVVRRVVEPEVAGQVTQALVEAVEEGTGTRARLAGFSVAGKSGTSRATGAGGRYEQGAYFSSFVGFFPASDPQLVVLVKLDRPRGAYYGGATAAPVTRATMEAVLAARKPPLDRRALAAMTRPRHVLVTAVPAPAPAEPFGSPDGASAFFASLSLPPDPLEPASPPPGPGARVAVPDVRGLSLRAAARRLHGEGLHVLWEGAGPVQGTVPGAGTALTTGDTVRIVPGTGRSPPGTPASRRARDE